MVSRLQGYPRTDGTAETNSGNRCQTNAYCLDILSAPQSLGLAALAPITFLVVYEQQKSEKEALLDLDLGWSGVGRYIY